MRIAIAGAGLTGAVIGRRLAEAGHEITIMEARSHIGGNCHTERDMETGVMVHTYGPHIFHTDDEDVWNYVNCFANFIPYVNRVKSTVEGKVYSLPINLHTINQYFNICLRPEEAREFVKEKAENIKEPLNFEEQALKLIGRELYKAFLQGYTEKQWGLPATQLPASILKRLPIRFNYNDNYFDHKYQGIPESGYTSMVESILKHPLISVKLNTSFNPRQVNDWDHVIWTGPLDGFFEYKLGRLNYRTLDFEKFCCDGDWQGTAVMNFGDLNVPFTRITEHKHFSPWEHHSKSIVCREYSREARANDIPYYPVRLVQDSSILADYVQAANNAENVTFAGRLATYRYIDMDVTIREAIDCSAALLKAISHTNPLPRFSKEP